MELGEQPYSFCLVGMAHILNVYDISNVMIAFFDLQMKPTTKSSFPSLEYINTSGEWSRHFILHSNGTASFNLNKNGAHYVSESLLVEDSDTLFQAYTSKPLFLRLMKIASYKNNRLFWVFSRQLNLELI